MSREDSSPQIQAAPKRPAAPLAVLPAVLSCTLSCVVGGVLGQIGNLIYAALGDAGICAVLPGFALLFLVTFGIAFFTNRWFSRRMRTQES